MAGIDMYFPTEVFSIQVSINGDGSGIGHTFKNSISWVMISGLQCLIFNSSLWFYSYQISNAEDNDLVPYAKKKNCMVIISILR